MYWVYKLSLCVFYVQTIVNYLGIRVFHMYTHVPMLFLCILRLRCVQVFVYTLCDHVILYGLHPSCSCVFCMVFAGLLCMFHMYIPCLGGVCAFWIQIQVYIF